MPITPRQKVIIDLLDARMSITDVATKLGITYDTVLKQKKAAELALGRQMAKPKTRVDAVYEKLCHAAHHGLPCPTNMELCDSDAAAERSIRNLIENGKIHRKPAMRGVMRIITIIATGESTRRAAKESSSNRVPRWPEYREIVWPRYDVMRHYLPGERRAGDI